MKKFLLIIGILVGLIGIAVLLAILLTPWMEQHLKNER